MVSLLAAAFTLGAGHAVSQTLAPRAIVRARGFVTDPIKLNGVFYDGKPIDGSAPFNAPDDWLSHISVKITNTSSKTLTAGRFQLTFDGIGGSTLFFYILNFGRMPDYQLYTRSGVKVPRKEGEVPIFVPPGETITIHFKDDYAALEKKLLAMGPLSNVKECTIDFAGFYFADGLRWAPNRYSREDPDHPGKYVPALREDLVPSP